MAPQDTQDDLFAPPSTTLLVKDIGTLGTFNKELGEIKDAAFFVRSNVIEWVGRTADLPKELASADVVLSMAGCVVIPGLVNTHHHMFQSLTRCYAQQHSLYGWLTTLAVGWAHITPEDVHTSAKLAMAELLLSGCTTTSDMLYLYPNGVKLDDEIAAARELGMRFQPSRGTVTKGKSAGGIFDDGVCEKEEEVLAEFKRLIATFHDPRPHAMLRIALAPCSPFTCSDDFFVKTAELARAHEGVTLHTHLAEPPEDPRLMMEGWGCTPSEFVKLIKWDGPNAWFAHCVQLTEADIDMFAGCGCGIAHCPSSNMRLASGIAKVRYALDNGANVGLGVDGTASNDAGNMINEARMALLLQRAGANPKGLSAREALRIATAGGAKNLMRDDIGEIAPGKAADFVAWKVKGNMAMAGAASDPIAGLVFCMPGNVHLSVINGRVIIRDGAFQNGLDLEALVAAHEKCSQRICGLLGDPAKTND